MPNNLTDVTDNNVGKMTDNEIKKALEGMIQFADMVNRSVLDMVDVQTLKNTLAYINRLQVENEELNEELKNLRTENKELKCLRTDLTSLKAENESLKNAYKQCAWERDTFQEENERLSKITRPFIAEIKAEAYTEFAERLKEWFRKESEVYKLINNLLKEKVGDSND